MERRGIASVFLILAAAVVCAASAAGGQDTGFAGVIAAAEKADGAITPGVREAYLAWAERTVLNQLAAAKVSIPEDCLGEVRGSPVLRDAMFGAVYPPDASILQNYARLRNALGSKFMGRYRSLVIGTAVAHRVCGVGGKDDPLASKEVADKDLFDVADQNEPEDDKNAPGAIADFMKANKLSALQIFEDESRQKQLIQYLKDQHVDAAVVARAQKPRRLAEMLKEAMVKLGQRPAAREAEPDVVTWLKYLATVYESHPTSLPQVKGKKSPTMTWPLFPMDKAPWPVLMPLSRPMPLGEAKYIMETFVGLHGPDRYHTYGPYRSRDKALLYELKPSPWHWDAWQDRIVHGGVCTTMSTISLDTHRALCEPAVHAGQPNHANLISYRQSGGAWTAIIEQAFNGGPSVTRGGWPFHDDIDTAPRMMAKNRCGSEYHLGLAAAMNLPLSTYIDTRMAVVIYNALPETQKKTVGVKLLNHTIETNPYNPAPWYLLAQQVESPAQGMDLTRRAMRNVTDSAGQNEVNATLDDILEAKGATVAKKQVQKYWRTVAEYVARYAIVDHPRPTDEATARNAAEFLRTVPGISPDEQPGQAVSMKGKKAK
jgi:hypothetical protein